MSQLSFDWTEVEAARYNPDSLYYTPNDRLIRLPEGQHLDRKSARVDDQGLCKTICAMANADAQGGVIAVGIHNGEIEGFEEHGEPKINRLMRAPLTLCPTADVDSKCIQLENKTVLLFRVRFSENRVVELSNGQVYHRVGDTDHRLTPEQVAQARDDRGEVSVETEVLQNTSIDDLDNELLEIFLAEVRSDLDLEFDKSPEDILIQRRLATISSGIFRLRLAGLVALGKDPLLTVPGCKIRFLRYEGIAERTGAELNVIKDISFEGPLPRILSESIDATLAQLREFRALRPDGKFDLRSEYPHDCVREAIVNAGVHRSYSLKNQPIFIRMFDDRLEIESPGGFISPVTAETIYQYHMPRNPFLMDAMRYLKIVRMANEGTRRMRHLMQSSDLPDPTFSTTAGPMSKVTVSLSNDLEQRRVWVDKDLTSIVGESLASSLTEEEKRVLNYLAEYKKITVSDALRITTSKNWHSARKILDRLIDRGLVAELKDKPRDPKAHFVLAGLWTDEAEN